MGKNILQIKTGHREKKIRTRTHESLRERASEREREKGDKEEPKARGSAKEEKKEKEGDQHREKKTNLAASQRFVPRDHQETVPSFSSPPSPNSCQLILPSGASLPCTHHSPLLFLLRGFRENTCACVFREKASSRRTDIGSSGPPYTTFLLSFSSISLRPLPPLSVRKRRGLHAKETKGCPIV